MIEQIARYKIDEVKGSPDKLEKLKVAYNKLFGEILHIGCDNCIADAIFRIKYYLRSNKNDKKMDKEKCNFVLKEGLVLYVPAWAMHVTKHNLTDDLAIKLIRKSRVNLKNFVKVPDNLDELLGSIPVDFKPTPPPVIPDEPKAEVKKEDKVIPTIEELIMENTKADLVEKVELKAGENFDGRLFNKTQLAEKLIELIKESK